MERLCRPTDSGFIFGTLLNRKSLICLRDNFFEISHFLLRSFSIFLQRFLQRLFKFLLLFFALSFAFTKQLENIVYGDRALGYSFALASCSICNYSCRLHKNRKRQRKALPLSVLHRRIVGITLLIATIESIAIRLVQRRICRKSFY